MRCIVGSGSASASTADLCRSVHAGLISRLTAIDSVGARRLERSGPCALLSMHLISCRGMTTVAEADRAHRLGWLFGSATRVGVPLPFGVTGSLHGMSGLGNVRHLPIGECLSFLRCPLSSLSPASSSAGFVLLRLATVGPFEQRVTRSLIRLSHSNREYARVASVVPVFARVRSRLSLPQWNKCVELFARAVAVRPCARLLLSVQQHQPTAICMGFGSLRWRQARRDRISSTGPTEAGK